MKDLSTLTNEELLAYYDEARADEEVDYTMDGSGDYSGMIAETWEPIWESFEAEFEKREIPMPEEASSTF